MRARRSRGGRECCSRRERSVSGHPWESGKDTHSLLSCSSSSLTDYSFFSSIILLTFLHHLSSDSVVSLSAFLSALFVLLCLTHGYLTVSLSSCRVSSSSVLLRLFTPSVILQLCLRCKHARAGGAVGPRSQNA